MTKVCSKCHRAKPLDAFSKHVSEKGGLRCTCKVCTNTHARQLNRQRTDEYKTKHRNYYRRVDIRQQVRQYQDDYYYGKGAGEWRKTQYLKQQGKCAICGRAVQLGLDHNHVTGLWRGLLCRMCNMALGMLRVDEQNEVLLLKAVEYIQSSKR